MKKIFNNVLLFETFVHYVINPTDKNKNHAHKNAHLIVLYKDAKHFKTLN